MTESHALPGAPAARDDPATAPAASARVAAAKAAVRTRARVIRDAAHGAVPDAGVMLAARFPPDMMPAAGVPVAGYWPRHGEIDPRPLLSAMRARRCVTVLPVTVTPGAELRFGVWTPGQALVPDLEGVPAPPDPGNLAPAVVLVPVLAFDRHGFRLGYGRGYYDRTLAALRARGPVLAVGLAFAAQAVQSLPRAAHDQPLDLLVTEQSVIAPEASGPEGRP